MNKLRMKKGFTLIELMIVVAIIGILAAIAIPQFAQLISKTQEGACKGNLGTLRSALSIYYGDTEGVYPRDSAALTSLTAGSKYLQVLPLAQTPKTTNNVGHTASNAVSNTDLSANPVALTDVSGWRYDNTGGSAWGNVVVNCSHSDQKGSLWTSY